MIDALPGDPTWKRAANGYELAVNHLALGELTAARETLTAALADARTVGDPMTLACVRRALGDFAAQTGDCATARAEYGRAQAAFGEAGAERAAEVQTRRDSL